MDTVERGSGGGSTVQYGCSAGGARLWKKKDGQITGLWIGSLYEEKDGKVLCHVSAGGRIVGCRQGHVGRGNKPGFQPCGWAAPELRYELHFPGR